MDNLTQEALDDLVDTLGHVLDHEMGGRFNFELADEMIANLHDQGGAGTINRMVYRDGIKYIVELKWEDDRLLHRVTRGKSQLKVIDGGGEYDGLRKKPTLKVL